MNEYPSYYHIKSAWMLLFITVTLSIVLSYVMRVSWDIEDSFNVLIYMGLQLGLSTALLASGGVPAIASFLAIFSLMTFLSLVEAALALLGTRSPLPLADHWLVIADEMLPFSAVEVVLTTQMLPNWAISVLTKAYLQTGSCFLFTLIALHFLDREAFAWRIFLIWGWSFLAISLIAFAAPAVGCFSQLSADQVEHLPKGAGRYAMRKFYEFRNAAEPKIGLDGISGVITFPSLHTVSALLIAQAWHDVRIVGSLTKILTGVIIFSCVPIGGHYIVDLMAGAAVWWGVTLAVDRLTIKRANASQIATIATPAA